MPTLPCLQHAQSHKGLSTQSDQGGMLSVCGERVCHVILSKRERFSVHQPSTAEAARQLTVSESAMMRALR